MAKKKVDTLNRTERVVSFLGSLSSIAGLLLAIPAFFAGVQLGKQQEADKKEPKA